jgi:hypothetical protein
MDRTTDLETALNFVSRRIQEQAKVSGHPLNEEEVSLLKNLPSSSASQPVWAPELGPPELVPRNINLERLCALAKAAHLNDHAINPKSLDWEFALAVFTLNHHPMWGVLHTAGVKMHRKPFLDRLFVMIAALVPILAVIVFAVKGPQPVFLYAGVLCGMVATMLSIYFASRQMEQRQLRNYIKSCRLASRNISWKIS